MKIAMVGTRGVPARYGGFETCVEEVGRRLVDRGHEVVVYCRTPLADEGAQAPALPTEHLGMELVHLPAVHHKVLETLSHTGLSAGHLLRERLTHRVTRRTPADVALVFNAANSVFLPVLRAAGIPVATHVDGLEWRRAKWGGAGRQFYRRAEALAVRWSDALIADADGISDYYRDEFDADTVRIAYGAPIIDAAAIGHAGVDELGLTPGGYHLVVARFEPENHVDVIVDGYVRSEATKPLVVVGSAPYSDEYTARVRALGDDRVRFLGGVWDQGVLDQLYANSATYLHGHSVGGTNPSLLRAMGAAAPSICFDVEFNREVTRAAGRYFRGPDDVARLVGEAERDPVGTVARGRAGQRRARDYDWDDVAGRYEQLCAELPARRAARVDGPHPTGARTGAQPRPERTPVTAVAPLPAGRRGLVLGTFDVLRASQLDLLARAGRECDRVTVGVLDRTASDPVAPRHDVVNTLTDRLLLARHLRGVDEVLDVDDLDPDDLAARFDVVYLDETVGLSQVESDARALTANLEVVDVPRDGAPRLQLVDDAHADERGGLVVGYIPGAWDALHAGHIAILDRARALCDRLVVGVADDETLLAVKGRLPLVPHAERMAIVASLSMADEVVADRSSDKRLAWEQVHFDVLFKGTDWEGTAKGKRLEAEMSEVGARLEYLPYTWRISTTRIRKRLDALTA